MKSVLRKPLLNAQMNAWWRDLGRNTSHWSQNWEQSWKAGLVKVCHWTEGSGWTKGVCQRQMRGLRTLTAFHWWSFSPWQIFSRKTSKLKDIRQLSIPRGYKWWDSSSVTLCPAVVLPPVSWILHSKSCDHTEGKVEQRKKKWGE